MSEIFEYIAEANESGIVKLQALQLAWDQERPDIPRKGRAQGMTVSRIDALAGTYATMQTYVSELFSKTIAFLAAVDENFKTADLLQAQSLLAAAISSLEKDDLKTRQGSFVEELNNSSAKDIFDKILGKAGHLGIVYSFLTKTVPSWFETGSFSVPTGAKTVATLVKEGNTFIKGLSAWVKSEKGLQRLSRMLPERAKEVRLQRLFGLNDMFSGKASQAGSWSTRFYNNYHKLDGPTAAYTKGGVKSACAWIGTGVSLVLNGIENKEEAESGKITTERAVAETVTETLVDVGTGWVIGTAVAAGVAATVGSAPVLLVGAATVGVTMGLDWACKKITKHFTGEEKDLTETISDAVLDVGEAAIAGGKKVVSALGSKLGTMGKSIRLGFNPLLI